jgi:hypothetical protein
MRRIGFAWLVTAGFVLGFGQLAGAADLQSGTPLQGTTAGCGVRLTGFYVGAHGGWARTDKKWFDPSGAELASYNVGGGIGGVWGGFNWQTPRGSTRTFNQCDQADRHHGRASRHRRRPRRRTFNNVLVFVKAAARRTTSIIQRQYRKRP